MAGGLQRRRLEHRLSRIRDAQASLELQVDVAAVGGRIQAGRPTGAAHHVDVQPIRGRTDCVRCQHRVVRAQQASCGVADDPVGAAVEDHGEAGRVVDQTVQYHIGSALAIVDRDIGRTRRIRDAEPHTYVLRVERDLTARVRIRRQDVIQDQIFSR